MGWILRATVAAATLASLSMTSGALAASPGATLLVSGPAGFGALPAQDVNDSGTYDGEPDDVDISSDGRFVVFASQADGLSAFDDDRYDNVFLRDRQTGETFLVSRAAGGAAADGDSGSPVVSDDGRLVAFKTRADNLGAPGGTTQVALVDRATGAVEIVSRADGFPAPPADRSSYDPDISGDGTIVVFSTDAALELADGDGDTDVYARRLSDDLTALVSPGAGYSGSPSISDNGNLIAFASRTTTLSAEDLDATSDVFVLNVTLNSYSLVSRADTAGGAAGNGDSSTPFIAGNGPAVAFSSDATNLDAGDADSVSDVYVRAGTETSLVSVRSDEIKADSRAHATGISDSGSHVAFASDADNLPADAVRTYYAAYLRDVPAGTTTEVSAIPSDGPTTGYAINGAPDGDASDVAFMGSGRYAADGDQEVSGVYVRRVGDATTELVSRPTGTGPFDAQWLGGRLSFEAALHTVSADGRYVVFESSSDGLLAGDDDLVGNVYRRDMQTGEVLLVSRADGSAGAAGNGHSDAASISADGSRVAFVSSATNLVGDDTDPGGDGFVRDLVAGTTTLVTRAVNGAVDPGYPSELGLAPGGGHVVWTTSAALDTADGNVKDDVYGRDLAAGTTTLVSRADGLPGAIANGDSDSPSVSSDGRRVAFRSTASNLGTDDADTAGDIFVRDVVAGTTTLVSRATGAAGVPSGATSVEPAISADGSRVAFLSFADNLVEPIDQAPQLFLRDLGTSDTLLVSRAPGGAIADRSAQAPLALSADGRKIAWTSRATNLAAEADDALESDAFVAAPDTGAVELASRPDGTADGSFAGRADNPSLSLDGECLHFAARGSGLVPGISPDFFHTYVRVLAGGDCPSQLPAPAGNPPASPPGTTTAVAPVIQSARLTRTRFRVGPRATALSAATRRGTTLRVQLDVAARLRIVVQRKTTGRRVRGACRRTTRANRRARRCTRWVTQGTLRRSLRAGRSSVAFSGRIGRKALRPGSHRLVLQAVANGKTSRARRLNFRIVRR